MAKNIIENITTSNSNSDINDIRVATGSTAPTDSNFNTLNGRTATTGDIYLKTSDYTVGTSNDWTYVVRADGVIEMWKDFTYNNFGYSGSWGSYVKYNNSLVIGDKLNYPSNITFSGHPSVFMTITQMSGSNCWLYALNGSSNYSSKAPNLGGARANAASTNSNGCHILYHVIGVGTVS